jgi:hypothetical protein
MAHSPVRQSVLKRGLKERSDARGCSPSDDARGGAVGRRQPSLDKKVPLGEFQGQLKTTCADKEAAFRAAILAQDKADGMSDKDAQADADDQVSEYVDKIIGEYEEYNKPGT